MLPQAEPFHILLQLVFRPQTSWISIPIMFQLILLKYVQSTCSSPMFLAQYLLFSTFLNAILQLCVSLKTPCSLYFLIPISAWSFFRESFKSCVLEKRRKQFLGFLSSNPHVSPFHLCLLIKIYEKLEFTSCILGQVWQVLSIKSSQGIIESSQLVFSLPQKIFQFCHLPLLVGRDVPGAGDRAGHITYA